MDKTTQIRKLLTPELRAKVEKRVRECLDRAAELWPEHKAKFQDAPEIRYDVKNRFGGYAISGGPDDWTIRLNLILCYENEAHFIEQTVGHEAAHLIQRVVFGSVKKVVEKGQVVQKKVRPHGAEWREVMVKLGLKPLVYHTYDTSSIETKSRRKRAKAGSLIGGGLFTPNSEEARLIADMRRRLETGFKRLPSGEKQAFIDWAEANLLNSLQGGDGDDE